VTYRIGDHADLITLSGEGQPRPEPIRTERTPEEKWRFGISFLLRFFGYPMAAFTVLLSIWTIVGMSGIYYELSHWPHTQALVDTCQITSQKLLKLRGQNPDQFSYGFHCAVTYTAGSQTYHSNADIGYQQNDNSDMLRWSDRIRAGDHIPIAYKPSDPARVRFAGSFSISYAPALHYLPVVAWLALLSFTFITFGRKLRLELPEMQ
jgi:hypothetical protein